MKEPPPPTGTKTVYLDIMQNGRFVCQLPFRYCPLFPIDSRDVEKYVFDKRPSLKGKDILISFSGNRVY